MAIYSRRIEPLIRIVSRRPLATLTNMPNQGCGVHLRLEHVDLWCASSYKCTICMLRTRVGLPLTSTGAQSLTGLVGEHVAIIGVAVNCGVFGCTIGKCLVRKCTDVARVLSYGFDVQ
jgi:hypothetical protein